jgi:cobalt-zinc-cadmium efflux system outer membrane protein
LPYRRWWSPSTFSEKEARARYIRNLYPALEAPTGLPLTAPGPEGRPLSLGDLERLAEQYSPVIRSNAAAVDAAKGAAQQAGAYPNPNFAYEYDTVSTSAGRGTGYPGFMIEQVIKTGGKLKLQEAAAIMDLFTARLALRRARSDLHTQIRTAYLGVLVAQENVRINEALFRFTHGLYLVQVELSEKGAAAAYEPMGLRPLVLQAAVNVEQARYQYQASWRQLAAALGLPKMPPTEVVGRIDKLPVPEFDYDNVLERVLANHTDVGTAEIAIQKAQYNLEMAKLVPLPDVDVKIVAQKDNTAPPFKVAPSAQMTVTVPLWDQNKGGIRQAQSLLAQAAVGPEQAQLTLTGNLADAWNRYRTNRRLVETTRMQVYDQIRFYRAAYERRRSLPQDVAFADIVTAQQTLSGYIAAYLTALQAEWTAINDIANLLQTEDLFQAAPARDYRPLPDFEELLPPPCRKHGHCDGYVAPDGPFAPDAPPEQQPAPASEQAPTEEQAEPGNGRPEMLPPPETE